MGARTKYQRSDFAQLFIYAKSGLLAVSALTEHTAEATDQKNNNIVPESDENVVKQEKGPEPSSEWKHSEWELGRRLVSETEGGEEVAVR